MHKASADPEGFLHPTSFQNSKHRQKTIRIRTFITQSFSYRTIVSCGVCWNPIKVFLLERAAKDELPAPSGALIRPLWLVCKSGCLSSTTCSRAVPCSPSEGTCPIQTPRHMFSWFGKRRDIFKLRQGTVLFIVVGLEIGSFCTVVASQVMKKSVTLYFLTY